MHVYSQPDFFFQNWREGIQRQALRKMSQMDLLSVSYCTLWKLVELERDCYPSPSQRK